MRLCGAAPAPGPSTHRHCDAYRVDFFAVGFPNGFRTTAHELADLAKEPSFQKTLHPNLDPHGRIYSQGSHALHWGALRVTHDWRRLEQAYLCDAGAAPRRPGACRCPVASVGAGSRGNGGWETKQPSPPLAPHRHVAGRAVRGRRASGHDGGRRWLGRPGTRHALSCRAACPARPARRHCPGTCNRRAATSRALMF